MKKHKCAIDEKISHEMVGARKGSSHAPSRLTLECEACGSHWTYTVLARFSSRTECLTCKHTQWGK